MRGFLWGSPVIAATTSLAILMSASSLASLRSRCSGSALFVPLPRSKIDFHRLTLVGKRENGPDELVNLDDIRNPSLADGIDGVIALEL